MKRTIEVIESIEKFARIATDFTSTETIDFASETVSDSIDTQTKHAVDVSDGLIKQAKQLNTILVNSPYQ